MHQLLRRLSVGQGAAVFEDVEIGLLQAIQPQIRRGDGWARRVASPGQPNRLPDTREKIADAVIQVATGVRRERMVGARQVAAAVVLVDQSVVDERFVRVHLSAKVVGDSRAAGVEIQRCGPENGQAQQPVDHCILEVGLVFALADAEWPDQGERADQLGAIGGDLHGISRRQASSNDDRAGADDVFEKVGDQPDVELAVVGQAGTVRAAPAEKIGGDDLVAVGELLGDPAPLCRAMARAEGMQENQRHVAVTEALKQHLAGMPGVAVTAAPAHGRQAPCVARYEQVRQSRKPDRGASYRQPLNQSLPALSALGFLTSLGSHDAAKIPSQTLACSSGTPAASERYNLREVMTSMPVRNIVRLGHPALRTPALPVDAGAVSSPEIQSLIDDLFETMDQAGGVGLAAPQVAEELQVFVFLAIEAGQRDEPGPEARRVLINPMVEPLGGELVYDWEGCLSIPDLRGLVPRRPMVRVHALDREGTRVDFTAEGYSARIIQHEFDHLNGIVFLDRMRDLRSLAFGDEWERYMTTDDDGETPVG